MVRVFIVDDSLGFGTLAAAWLDGYDDLEVVGNVRTVGDALRDIVRAGPDVVLLDRLLPQPEQSAEILAHIRQELPRAAVVLLSGMPEDHLAAEARALRADGHVSKATDADGLAAAVRRAARGRP
jgi:DNA-binding NarL/FixJ family response regulator